MSFKITVEFEGIPTATEIAQALRTQADAIAKGPGRPAGKKTAATEETEADPVAETETPEESDDLNFGTEEETAPEPTEKDVFKALNGYLKDKGKEATKKLLAKFGAKSGKELKAKDYAKILSVIQPN